MDQRPAPRLYSTSEDIVPKARRSFSRWEVDFGEHRYDGNLSPNQPWVSDGTTLGTHLLKDLTIDFVYSPGVPSTARPTSVPPTARMGTSSDVGRNDRGNPHRQRHQSRHFSSLDRAREPRGNLLVVADNGLSGFELMTSGNPDPKPHD